MIKQKFFVLLSFFFAICSQAFADYALPIDFEVYSLAGSYDMNFELTDAMKSKIASEWPQAGLTVDQIHSFADIALEETWTVRNLDFWNLANWGLHGVTKLPLTESGTGDDVYVVQCYFGDDVSEGERIDVDGFKVDISTLESNFEQDEHSGCIYVMLDESFNRIFRVPASKTCFLAVKLFPSNINTGILSVIRGEYIAEDDPNDRLDATFAQNIADELGIDITELKYLSQIYIGKPVPPTEAMKEYVKNDNHEIIANLPTLSADKDGYYVVRVTLDDDVFESVKDKDTKDYKPYGLNDDELGDKQFQPAFILGLINTWELLTLQGKKMNKFGAKEFLMVGFLNSGKPFSFYLGKILLSLLLGGMGCDTNFAPYMIVAVTFVTIALYRRKIR